MALKSTSKKFGNVPVLIHWVTAFMIIGLVLSGTRIAGLTDPAAKTALLKIHAPVGSLIGILTLFRIVWWLFMDKKPNHPEGSPRWQNLSAQAVHLGLYFALLLMAASGIGMFILSGAGPIISGWVDAPLPDFNDYPPRQAHGLGVWLLGGLLVAHVGAALYHTLVLKDGLLRRMWFSRG